LTIIEAATGAFPNFPQDYKPIALRVGLQIVGRTRLLPVQQGGNK
jgi:hypothetical protein